MIPPNVDCTREKDTYDFIVVGGGTAGCIVASRLSEAPDIDVILLEAGESRNDDPKVKTPGLYSQMLGHSDYDWKFETEPQETLGGRVVQHSRGKLLGGCSAINVQILAFPSREDLDDLSELGIKGWDWETVEPYYRKFHLSRMPHAEYHDDHHLSKAITLHDFGPLKTSRPSPMDPLAAAWLKTVQSMQPTDSEDVQPEYSIDAHAVPCAVAPDTHERSHSGKAYVDLAVKRANFHLMTAAHVERINFESRTKDLRSPGMNAISSTSPEDDAVATGVLVSHKGEIRTIKARKEVILCAGTFGSPQLLELSGIGNTDLLDEYGIDVVVDNPNVGENLQDHISVGLSHEVKPEVKTLDTLFRNPEVMDAALADYNLNKAGPLRSSPVQAIAFLPSTVLSTLPPNAPSVQSLLDIYLPLPTTATTTSPPTTNPPALTPKPYTHPSLPTQHTLLRSRILSPTSPTATLSPIPQAVYPSPSPFPKDYLTTLLMLSYPLSRGNTHIRSPRPNIPPTIAPNYLSHPLDLALTALHLMHANTLFTLPPLAGLLSPPETAARLPHGQNARTYDAAVDLLKAFAGTFYHPVGTCAMMGREMGGVVGERLVVYGTRNLRIVDASVIPLVPRGNVASSVFAWGERGAQIVREEWEGSA